MADTEGLKNWMIDLLNANPELTGGQAREYAQQILETEAREDFEQMTRVIQKALFCRHCKPAA